MLAVCWPCFGRALDVLWTCFGRALAVPWPCFSRALAYNETGNETVVKVVDFTHLDRVQRNFAWNGYNEELQKELTTLFAGTKEVVLDNTRGGIRETLPFFNISGERKQQLMLNIYT